jgi:ankyrin repeat protein
VLSLNGSASFFAGKTPVAHAAVAGKVDVLRYLLDRGGDPAMPDPMGTTPLHDAADFGALIRHGA